MKRSLFLSRLVITIALVSGKLTLDGQTVIFTENFSGFLSGTHSTPSTADVSGILDTKTLTIGWTGSKVYSAGGEVKIGTSDIPGWIESPLIDFSGYNDTITLKFDIARWPGITSTIQVSVNGNIIGSPLCNTDAFTTIELPLLSQLSPGKIKFESSAKRFFLDNLIIFNNDVTSIDRHISKSQILKIFPNPAVNYLTIELPDVFKVEFIVTIADPAGKLILQKSVSGSPVTIDVSTLETGYYILSVSDGSLRMSDRIIVIR